MTKTKTCNKYDPATRSNEQQLTKHQGPPPQAPPRPS